MAAYGKRPLTLRQGWRAGHTRNQRWAYHRAAVMKAIRSVTEAASARAMPVRRGRAASGLGRWRPAWPPPWRLPRRRPWVTGRGLGATDGAGRAFQVLFAVAVIAVVGAAGTYVLSPTSTPSTGQSEPNVPQELDLSWPTPAPVSGTATPTPTQPAPTPGGKTATPRPSPRKPRPAPTSTKPRIPVQLISEAESAQHDTSGNTRPRSNRAASGETVIGWLGNGSDNRLWLSVTVPDTDWYAVTLFYISEDSRQAVVRVNGGVRRVTDFPPTGDWSTVRTLVLRLALRGGRNTIELGNPYDYGPDIDRIMVTR